MKKFGWQNQKWNFIDTNIFITNVKKIKIILVHNTFTSKQDVEWTKENNYSIYWCTCPKANLYIENCLPDYSIFDKDKLCIGTDSLTSNSSLSILEELKILQENTDFDFNTLLKIACKNGGANFRFKRIRNF